MSLVQITARIVSLVDTGVIPVLYALAFIYFLIGIARYFILNQESEEAREKGRKMAIFGLIGIAVLFVVWGLVNALIGVATSITGVGTT